MSIMSDDDADYLVKHPLFKRSYLPPVERLRQFFLSIDQWELDGGDKEEIISELLELRHEYTEDSSGYEFINQAIILVKAED